LAKRKILVVNLSLLVAVLFIIPLIYPVRADLTVTRTFTSSSSDGYIYASGSGIEGYSDAYDAATGTVSSSASTFSIGQQAVGAFPSATYTVWRGFLFFDTSIIPSTANVTSAVLSLYVSANYSTTDFNVTIQSGMPTYPHDPLQSSDFYYSWYGSSTGGSRNTAEISGTGYWNITLTSTGLSWISFSTTTKLCLRSGRDISSTTPTGDEYVTFSTSEAGSTQTPKLIVTYTVPVGGAGIITIHAPYLETGAVFNGTVNATLYYANNQSETLTFDGTDGSADTVQSTSDTMPINVYWNCTSDYTKERVYTFNQYATTDEIWLHVADTNIESLNQYYISITDFAGITNATVSTIKNVGGNIRTIEKQPLDVINDIPFWLITYNQYTLEVDSDQGTFTWSLPADVIGTKSYVITKDMVTQENTARNFTVSATRLNGSIINIEYYDPNSATLSVTTTITYYANYEWLTAYTQTDASDSDLNYNWTTADATKKYTVLITATTTAGTYNWQFALDPPALTNPFGSSLDFMGNWGFPANQIPGLVIAGLFFGLLSWRDTEIGCAIGVAITGILWLVGLLEVPVMGVAMGFMLVIFMYLHEGKESLRIPP